MAIICDRDYMVADLRSTHTFTRVPVPYNQNEIRGTNHTRFKTVQFDDEVKIFTPTNAVIKNPVSELRIAALGFQGCSSFFDPLNSAFSKAEDVELISLLNDLLKGERLGKTEDIIFGYFLVLTVTGSRFILSVRPHNKRVIVSPDFRINKRFIGIGDSFNGVSNIIHNVQGEIEIEQAFSLVSLMNDETSLSYSVYGRREKEFWPVVIPDPEIVKKKAQEVVEKYKASVMSKRKGHEDVCVSEAFKKHISSAKQAWSSVSLPDEQRHAVD